MIDDRLRRLLRHIALGLPFAIPVVTAPFNVGEPGVLGARRARPISMA